MLNGPDCSTLSGQYDLRSESGYYRTNILYGCYFWYYNGGTWVYVFNTNIEEGTHTKKNYMIYGFQC